MGENLIRLEEFTALQEQYLLNTKDFLQIVMNEIKARRSQVELLESEVEDVKQENERLKNYIAMLEAQLKSKKLEESVSEEKIDVCNNKTNVSVVKQETEMMNIEELMKQIKQSFIAEEEQKLIGLLEYTYQNAAYYNTLWENRLINQLLCISYFYNYDKKMIQNYSSIREYLKIELEGNKLYRLLCQDREKKIYDKVKICASRYMETHENIYGFEGKAAKELRKKIKRACIPYRKEIFKKSNCCSRQIGMKEMWVFMKDSAGAVKVEAKYCKKCSKFYLERHEVAHINILIAPHEIKTKLDKEIEQKIIISNNNQEISKSTSGELNINLNKTSPLMQMGYTTSKSEQERWRILTQHAMPTLGKEKTKNYLKLFIKMHGSKANMKNAVAAWQKDLNKIESYF